MIPKLAKNKNTEKYERVKRMNCFYHLRTIPVTNSVIDQLEKGKIKELQQVAISPADNLFIFTYTTQNEELSHPLHLDYLNNKLDARSEKI